MIEYIITFLIGAIIGVTLGILAVFKSLKKKYPIIYYEMVWKKEIDEYNRLKKEKKE